MKDFLAIGAVAALIGTILGLLFGGWMFAFSAIALCVCLFYFLIKSKDTLWVASTWGVIFLGFTLGVFLGANYLGRLLV